MFSFIIRTKNEDAFLIDVLEAINKQVTKEKVEVIIVDSGSTDNTLAIAEKYACRIIKISPKEFSWGYALNLGIKYSKGEYIGIISGHCIPINEKFISTAIEILSDMKDLAAVYGRQVAMRDMDPFEEVDLNYYYPELDLDVVHMNEKSPIGVSNACCVLNKSVWNIIKFDETAQSCEDGMWCDAVLSKGYGVAYTSQIGVFHSHKLDADYLYKKYYWREYCPENNREHTHGLIYNFLKFMLKKNCEDFWFYFFGKNKIKIKCSIIYIIYYILIRNIAMMKAAIDLTKHLRDDLKYEQIKTPRFVCWLQKLLSKDKFWDYYN